MSEKIERQKVENRRDNESVGNELQPADRLTAELQGHWVPANQNSSEYKE